MAPGSATGCPGRSLWYVFIQKRERRLTLRLWLLLHEPGSWSERLLSRLAQRVEDWWERSQHRLAILGVGLLAALIGYHAVFGANGFVVYQQKRSELRRLQLEVQQLQEENAQREQRIKALRNDPQAIEKEARERLRYARPGEVVYTLPPAAAKSNQPSK